MAERAFGKHNAWKKAAVKKTRSSEIGRQTWADQDQAAWDANLPEIIERRQARLANTPPSTAERLATERANWQHQAE